MGTTSLVPLKIDRFADAQSMAVHHHDEQVVAVGVASGCGGIAERDGFFLGEVFAGSGVDVARLGRRA